MGKVQRLIVAYVGDLSDGVQRAIEMPLRVHLSLTSEREPVRLLVVPQDPKHRLHRADF